MNSVEEKTYQRLRKVPAKLRESSAMEPIYRASQERFKAEEAAINVRNEQFKLYHDSLRSVVQGSQQLEALWAVPSQIAGKPHPLAIPKLTRMPAPKSPKVRLGSFVLIDTPPFEWGTWHAESGASEVDLQANSGGNISFEIIAGLGPGGSPWGSGQASCWAGAGQDFAPPVEGLLRFSASTGYSWIANWVSNWWCEAAGTIWIGQFISRFDQSGVFVDMPVSTQNAVYSFDDRNFADRGNQSGSNSGLLLQAELTVDPNFFYRCFVWIGGSANGDFSNKQSWAQIAIGASFTSITLQLFD